jgi:hypothetical protein
MSIVVVRGTGDSGLGKHALGKLLIGKVGLFELLSTPSLK